MSGLEPELDRAPVLASARGARGARASTFLRVGVSGYSERGACCPRAPTFSPVGLSGYSDQSFSGRLLDEAGGGRSPAESALSGAASKAPQASKMSWTS